MSRFRRTIDDDQVSILTRYLPHGRAWDAKYRQDTVFGRTVRGFAAELTRVNNFIVDLICSELDIDRTVDLILEWEKSVGIPDLCFGRDASLPDRRERVKQKLVNFGGVTTEADFVRAFATFNIPVEITIGDAGNAELLGFPAPPYDAAQLAEIASTLAIRTSLASTTFPLPFPIPFVQGNQTLPCLMNRLMPATADLKFFFGQNLDVVFGGIGGPLAGVSPFVSDAGLGAVTQGGPLFETSPFVSDTVIVRGAARAEISETSPFVNDSLSSVVSLSALLSETAPFVTDELQGRLSFIAEIVETSPFVADSIEGTIGGLASLSEISPFVSDAVVGSVALNSGVFQETAPFVTDSFEGTSQGLITISEVSPFVTDSVQGVTANAALLNEVSPFVSDTNLGTIGIPPGAFVLDNWTAIANGGTFSPSSGTDRVVVICAGQEGTDATISGVTFGGVAPFQTIGEVNTGAGFLSSGAIFLFRESELSSLVGNVVTITSDNPPQVGNEQVFVASYRGIDQTDPEFDNFVSSDAASPEDLTGSLTTSNVGFAIGFSSVGQISDAVWAAGVVEQFEEDDDSSSSSVAHGVTTGALVTVDPTWSGFNRGVLLGLSLRPSVLPLSQATTGNVSSDVNSNIVTGSQSVTFDHDNDTDGTLLVFVGARGDVGAGVTATVTVTYNGVSAVLEVDNDLNLSRIFSDPTTVWAFTLAAPSSGINSLVATVTSAGNNIQAMSAVAVSLGNDNGIGPNIGREHESTNVSSTSAPIVASSVDNLIIGCTAPRGANASPFVLGSGYTNLAEFDTAFSNTTDFSVLVQSQGFADVGSKDFDASWVANPSVNDSPSTLVVEVLPG